MLDSLFMPVIANSGVTYAFQNSDLLGQLICVVLFLFSIAVWVVMLEKIITLKNVKRSTINFSAAFARKRDPLQLKDQADNDESPAARVFQAACDRIEAFHLREQPGGPRRALSDDEIQIVKATMSQSVEEQILLLEKRMIFLATAVSASPFLGLFGTVWGITLAFTNLAIQGRADIQTLAPGVSGALLTTVIALFVAIPSLVGYNIIASSIKDITVRLDNFSENVAARLKIEQMESIQAYEKRNRE